MSSDNAIARTTGRPALWFWAAAGLGLAWNVFAPVQFVGSLSATSESLQAQGMTADQAAYIALYLGDIVHGVFAALGTPQVAVLSAVVLIAADLLWLSRRARAQGVLV